MASDLLETDWFSVLTSSNDVFPIEEQSVCSVRSQAWNSSICMDAQSASIDVVLNKGGAVNGGSTILFYFRIELFFVTLSTG